jgi:hypothetical protein
LWILDHLDDLESDFSVFHRIDNIYGLPAREFVAKAERMSAYAGVMQARVIEEKQREEEGGVPMQTYNSADVAPRRPQAAPQRPSERVQALTPDVAVGNGYGARDGWAPVIEWGEAG